MAIELVLDTSVSLARFLLLRSIMATDKRRKHTT